MSGKFIELRARLLANGIMINVSAIWRWLTKKEGEKKMSTYLKKFGCGFAGKIYHQRKFPDLVDIFVKVRALLAAEEDWYDDAAQGVIQSLLEAMSLADEVTAAEKAVGTAALTK